MAFVGNNTDASLRLLKLCILLIVSMSTLQVCVTATSTASMATSVSVSPTDTTATPTITYITSQSNPTTVYASTTPSTSSTASDSTTSPASPTASDSTTSPTSSTASDSTTSPTSSTASDSTTSPASSTASDSTRSPASSTASDSTTSPTSSTASDSTTSPTSLTTSDSTSVSTTTTTPVTTTKAPPQLKFENISMVVTLNVRETQNKVLDTIVCLNYTGSPSTVKVSLSSVEPKIGRCARCFQILPCLTDWCLKFIPNVGTLDIGRDPVYNLSITCQRDDGYWISRMTEVRLTTNSPPIFNYTGLYIPHTVANTRNIKIGHVIYSVVASDADGDSLRYTMTVSPDNGNFQIGESDGVIRTLNVLSQECSQAVTFQVYVTDNINSLVGPLVISTTLDDSNTAPSITNMGEVIQVPENTVGTIYSIIPWDESPGTLKYTLTVVPNQAKSFVSITGNDIKLTSQLDYENPVGGFNRMTLTVRALDDGGCSSGIRTLYVEVTDVNEPPLIVPPTWTTTVYEGMIDFTPGWQVQDPDFNDEALFSFQPARSDFVIDTYSGAITSIGDYDLDSQKKQTLTLALAVKVTDKGGKTATATLTLIIRDANDNAPVINSASPCPVDECTRVGTVVCTLSARDADSAFQSNNVIYFGSQTSTYFTVMHDGKVVLTSPMRSGDYSTATVYAFDQGQYPRPLQSQPGFVAVFGRECPTTTTRTTTTTTTKATSTTTASTQTADTSTTNSTATGNKVEYNFMTENLPWMMVAALLGTSLVALFGFMVCRYARPVCSKPASERISFVKSTQPVNSQPEPHSNIVTSPKQDSLPVLHNAKTAISVAPEQPKLFNFWSTMT